MIKVDFELKGLADVKKMLSPERLKKVILNTINDTARLDVKPAIQQEMKEVFDRPTPYTLNSVYTRLNSSDMSVDIGLKEWAGKGGAAADYLKPQIYGGSRPMKRSERHLGSYYVPGPGARGDYVLCRIHVEAKRQICSPHLPGNSLSRERRPGYPEVYEERNRA